MNGTQLATRLRASESALVWSVAGVACRFARRFSRHRSRWSSRLGYVLERRDQARAGRHDAAADRLVRLADRHDRVGEWSEAQELLQENVAQHPTHALSYRRLGEVSLALAQWGGAFTGTLNPAPRPRPAPEPQAGTSPDRRFRFDQPPAQAAAVARDALERAATLEPDKTAWRMSLAQARVAAGDLAGAIPLYEAALRDAEESTGRWVLAVKHRWQFALESTYHQLGQARVEDPLFECTVTPAPPASDPLEEVVGLFHVRTTFAGLAITGLVASGQTEQVEILLDGQVLRAVNVGGDGPLPQFGLELRRSTLVSFPRTGVIEVRTAAGADRADTAGDRADERTGGGAPLRTTGGARHVRVEVPHGTGQLRTIIDAGGRLDKKGMISPSAAEMRLRQDRYLAIYAKVRDFFEQELGRPLFLMYGTLLGCYRDGDFIPGDDDFDAGYVSDRTDPVAVKEETKDLIVELVRAGFTVSFNRKGRLFRIQLEREATDGYHLDMRPLWFQDGRLWVHNHCSFPSTREDFLPVAEGTLRGERVLIPRQTETFLRGHYGPGWKVPDPGFMYYTSEIDPAILDHLGMALLTVKEYKELTARIRREVGDSPTAGRLVSVGSQDLYPLDDFLA